MLFSAFLIVLSFPPASLRPLAWIALVPLLVTLRRTTPGRAALLGGLWGMAGAYGVTRWLPPAVAVYYHQPLWLGIGLFVSAAFVMGGIYYMAFAALYSAAGRARLLFLPVLAASFWVSAELGRARVLTGNPWGLLGYTQAGGTWLAGAGGSLVSWAPISALQVADFGGVYAVTFLVVLVNAALAELWLALVHQLDRNRALLRDGSVAIALVLAGFVYGHAQLGEPLGESSATVPIAIAQANLDLGSQWNESLYGRNLESYLELTIEAAQEARPRVVYWPENAMTFFVDREPAWRRAVARITRPHDIELLAGAPRYEEKAPDDVAYFNTAFVLSPAGEITAFYDKEQLLPFTEYFPFGSSSFLRRKFARVREFTPGTRQAPMETRAGKAGIVICNEAMFPRLAGARVAAGAEYLVNLSTDTWVSDPEFAEHQFNLVSLRAVETRRFLVRASTSGPSGVVDPYGRIVVRTDAFTRAHLAGEIRPIRHASFYSRHGDAFAVTCSLVTLLALVAVLIRRPRTIRG
ncbi:MAG: apolipoprotein N-acyltransferase [Myxococcales bacterium]|nr:MAG: apolipoprotein N-acyltransferase [Myxococcales bacterium]